MATSKNTLYLMKAMYWIVLLGAQLYICYLLFTNSRPIAGVIWLILGLMIIYLMYPLYFPRGDPGSHWPPYITACPDYLTLLGPNQCVDMVGLGSRLLKWNPENPPSPSDSTFAQYVFNPSGTREQKAANATANRLTWEGITD
jgi:hypothetical protein